MGTEVQGPVAEVLIINTKHPTLRLKGVGMIQVRWFQPFQTRGVVQP